jgi:hypothetical protein
MELAMAARMAIVDFPVFASAANSESPPQESFASKPAGIAQAWTHVEWKREVVDVGVASYGPMSTQSIINPISAISLL